MKINIISAAVILVVSFCMDLSVRAQTTGCTDSLAKNYRASALFDDGSCHYKKISVRLKKGIRLNDSLFETSGLIATAGYLITHNDGGNDPNLFFLNPDDGSVVKKVFINQAINVDWEEICQDENFIYIGDFGNNNGNRNELSVYFINKDKLLSMPDSITVDCQLNFTFENQSDQKLIPYLHNFDCEAFLVLNDTFWFFTKNWQNHFTNLYALPISGKSQTALLVDSFFVNGLITSATFDNISQTLYLLGYNNFKVFLWHFYDFSDTDFFKGHFRRIELRNREQAEGLCWHKERLYISTEKSWFGKNKLFRLKLIYSSLKHNSNSSF